MKKKRGKEEKGRERKTVGRINKRGS